MNKILIQNPRIINEGRSFIGSVLVEGDKIAAVFEGEVPGNVRAEANQVIDATGKWLIPGVIDDQVHFRDPGLTHKGDIGTESRAAVAEIAAAWDGAELPAEPGRATPAILDAVIGGRLDALVVGGIEVEDLPDAQRALTALERATFVVSLEQRPSTVTEHADVVFPVAAVAEKSGIFVDWEGRPRWFTPSVDSGGRLSDHRVLAAIAAEAGTALGCDTTDEIHAQLQEMGAWTGKRADLPGVTRPAPVVPNTGHALLASWRLLLDRGAAEPAIPLVIVRLDPARVALRVAYAPDSARVLIDWMVSPQIASPATTILMPL